MFWKLHALITKLLAIGICQLVNSAEGWSKYKLTHAGHIYFYFMKIIIKKKRYIISLFIFNRLLLTILCNIN